MIFFSPFFLTIELVEWYESYFNFLQYRFLFVVLEQISYAYNKTIGLFYFWQG
jgi:hypothetical protein